MLPLPFHLARKWLRTHPAPAGVTKPIAVREVEELIPTFDEQGHLWTVIRTRTLARFQAPSGVVEIEQARRHTLPGYGHVSPIAEDEYVVFRNHMKLQADPQLAVGSALPETMSAQLRTERNVGYTPPSAGSKMASQAQVSVHRQFFAVVAGLVLVSIPLAILTLPPRHDPSPLFNPLTPTAPSIATVIMPNESALASVPTTWSGEVPLIASPKGVSPVKSRNAGAHGSLARVALAIRPWGVVYVNGKKQGPSPPIKELELKRGRHTVEVRNDAYPPYRIALDLRTKASEKVAHDFTKADTADAKTRGPSLASVSRSHPRFLSEEWPR